MKENIKSNFNKNDNSIFALNYYCIKMVFFPNCASHKSVSFERHKMEFIAFQTFLCALSLCSMHLNFTFFLSDISSRTET